jgi:anti-sigma factor RsiW
MSCDDVGPLLLRRLDGRLEADDRHRLESHLEQCAACREELEAQQAVATTLASRPSGGASTAFVGRVMAAVEQDRDWLDVLNWRAWTFRLVPVAAALVLVALLGFGPTEAAEPLEFADLVAEWVVEDDAETLPPFAVFWEDGVADETLLEAVLTASRNEQ